MVRRQKPWRRFARYDVPEECRDAVLIAIASAINRELKRREYPLAESAAARDYLRWTLVIWAGKSTEAAYAIVH